MNEIKKIMAPLILNKNESPRQLKFKQSVSIIKRTSANSSHFSLNSNAKH